MAGKIEDAAKYYLADGGGGGWYVDTLDLEEFVDNVWNGAWEGTINVYRLERQIVIRERK